MNSVTSQNNVLSCSVDAYEESPAEPSVAEGLTESEATLVIKLGYRGAAFCGFAEQPTQRSVAGDLRRALETVLRREVELTCAGRTDAGVHAQAQYVSLPVY
ncbi:MAG: tRNA pseudouridine(38-40) synthase TruA, partial [Atopobium sp.]|nr:tRNA pseudouridine(38-40) synthase TruA [Atopobium sp.]